jgi:hypothetical protein
VYKPRAAAALTAHVYYCFWVVFCELHRLSSSYAHRGRQPEQKRTAA